jgi:MFS family permease
MVHFWFFVSSITDLPHFDIHHRVYLISVCIFELGSLFCAIAKSIEFLIFGRAVAGVGGAGIFVSIFTIIAQITRLKDRPMLFGFFGGVFGISSVCSTSVSHQKFLTFNLRSLAL